VIRNHGAFAVGPDIRAALAAALATEEAARAYLLARAIGEPARVPSLEVARLRTLGGLTGV
jgi:L-ribulose-5-phosphate 4-epimerase